MGKYKATIPAKANKFKYNNVEYGPGSTLESDNPCDMLGFAKAYQDKNPGSGKTDATPKFWSSMQAACPAGNGGTPAPAPASPPVEDNPAKTGGDSADNQGAPKPVDQGPEGKETASPGEKPADPPPGDEPTRPPSGEPHPGLGDEQPQNSTNAGDPVELFSGAFTLQDTDLEVPNTLLPLSFTRVYRSGIAVYGPLGWNWDHNYNLYLRELNDGNIALWRSLHEDIFRFDGAGYEPPRGVFEKLEHVSGLSQVYEITREGGYRLRFERPAGWVDGERIPLKHIEDRHGNALRFAYDSEDRLAEVRDDDDRFLHFEYDLCGLLVGVSDHADRKYRYVHDEQTMHLVSATSPPTSDHPDGITRIYHYTEPFAPVELRHNIVRVEDASGAVYLENAYDEDPSSWSYARVVEQLYGGYLFQFQYTQLQSVPADAVYINIPAVRVETLNPDFGLETYTFNYRGDLLDRRFRLVKDKSFRVVAVQYEFDEQGNLAATTKPDGSQERNIYDAANPDPRMRGKLLQKELVAASGFPVPSRIVWHGKYEPLYQLLIEEKNETNSVTRYRYDFDVTPASPTNTGKLRQIVHPDATLPDGSVQKAATSFEHNPKGQVTATVLPDGTRQEMTYGTVGDAASRLISQVHDAGGLGITNQIAYSPYGYDTDTVDGNGHLTHKSINALGLMESEILPAVNGKTANYVLHYNADRRVVGFERPCGDYADPLVAGGYIMDRFERDELGYATRCRLNANTSDPRTVNVCFDYRGFPLATINPDGSRVDRTYDERGLVLTETMHGTDGTESTRRQSYDRSGNLAYAFDAGGLQTKYEYDGFSRLSKVTAPNGTKLAYRWQKGDVLESSEASGEDGFGNLRTLSKTTFAYDEKFRKISETVSSFTDNPGAAISLTTTFFHDNMDRPVRIVDHRGGIQSFQYDGLGRTTVHTDAAGNEERFAYDGNGNLTQQDSVHLEPDGSTSTITRKYAYDERNRQTEIIEPDGASIVLEYDDRDLPVRMTDYLGRIKRTDYNALGNRISETYDAGGLAIAHRWTLDSMSRPIAYIDPTGQNSHYHLDGIGRVVKTDYPNGFSSTRHFNAQGLVAEETLASGAAFKYSYDSAHRLSKISNTASPAPLTPVLDSDFAYDGLNRLVSAAQGANSIVRKYDSLGRLIAEEAMGAAMTCDFDDLQGVADKTWPDARRERHSHDLNSVLTKIEETSHGNLGSGISLIATLTPSGGSYFGELNGHGNLKLAARYDQRKRIVDLAINSPSGMAENVRYCYDAANRRRIEAFDGQKPITRYFEFDHKYRLALARDGFVSNPPLALTQADQDAAISAAQAASAAATHEESFSYDDADARLLHAQTGNPSASYTYQAGHRIKNDGAANYLYAVDGMLRNDGVFTYEADSLGRITAVKSGASMVLQIGYDALGRVSSLVEAGKPPRDFHYFGDHIEQENENGVPARQTTLHPATGVPIAYHTNGATFYPLFDGRYNLIGLANTNGDLVESYRYLPFGQPQIFDAAGMAIPDSQFGVEPVFGGQRFLSASNLYLAKRRLMNPRHGIFLSPDPRGYANSASLYAYAAQNPIDLIDPDGEFAFLAVLAVMAVGAVVAGGLNAARQGIQMAEDPRKRKEGFSWSELGMSMGFGAVAAPLLVVAPELAVPLAAYGVYGGIEQMGEGNYATGTFDIITSLAPFGSKGVRGGTLGRGSAFGQMRGLGPMDTPTIRLNRFTLIENNFQNFKPSPFGKRIGLGFSRVAPGQTEGHTAVILEKEGGGFWFVEKNAAELPDGRLVAHFREAPNPLDFYMRRTMERPFEYETVKIPKGSVEEAMNYGKNRLKQHLNEPFDRDCQNCSHFAADMLGKAGFKGMGNGRASGLFSDFTNFGTGTNMTYASPFWSKLNFDPSSSK